MSNSKEREREREREREKEENETHASPLPSGHFHASQKRELIPNAAPEHCSMSSIHATA
jgi:hypothetical protein